MSGVTLVIADMAGTTITDDGVVLDAFELALAASGVAPGSSHYARAQETVRATMGQSKIDVFRLILDTDAAAEAANTAFESAFAELVGTGRVKPIPGTEAAFAELRGRGCKLALTTGFSAQTRDILLQHLDWWDEVDLALSPSDVGRGRPYPDMIWAAMLGLATDGVAEVAVVGDTASDMQAATRAGVGFRCGVLTGADDSRRLRGGGATHVLASFADLPDVL